MNNLVSNDFKTLFFKLKKVNINHVDLFQIHTLGFLVLPDPVFPMQFFRMN